MFHKRVIQVRFYFENFIVRNVIVQSDFNLDIRFKKI
jgi:hypothetical protein